MIDFSIGQYLTRMTYKCSDCYVNLKFNKILRDNLLTVFGTGKYARIKTLNINFLDTSIIENNIYNSLNK